MLQNLYRGIVAATTLFVTVLLAASLLNRAHPAFDSLSHFRMHLLAATTVALAIAALSSLKRITFVATAGVVAALAASWPYLPGLGPPGNQPASSIGHTLRIVDFNTRFDNRKTGLARDVILAADPDVIILQEVTDTPAALMNLLRDGYPFQIRCEGSAIGGAAVISRLPLAGDDAIRCFDTPFLSAISIDVAGNPLTVASYHAHWPWPHSQHRWIDELSGIFSVLPHPLIIGGDFNATPWSEGVQRIARLSDTLPVTGLRPSWLTPALPGSLRASIGLPIDHLLVSKEIVTLEARTLPFAGSDHLPVFYRVLLR
ncbi:endonuclease/exonuclease/phosphatase family protein [Oricola thermophila]|uniref:Endonuclease/exonuclease/phosphatase family protein n=1 Tax=Oricola thermophila TaxID=2742145 RepID=A0A6N1VCJ9_9HYPH|nr:endonuclease/exonuclease/phosphatase family protein [Oricola thermophila]QKV18600.1 endonuclease/exonuclease/phosphatase family protein [Oricola thermophila]